MAKVCRKKQVNLFVSEGCWDIGHYMENVIVVKLPCDNFLNTILFQLCLCVYLLTYYFFNKGYYIPITHLSG